MSQTPAMAIEDRRAYDVVGWGVVAVDDIFHVERYPEPDTKVRVEAAERRMGGLTSVALMAAAELGGAAGYAGVLGEDDLSRYILEALAASGVDVSHVVRRPGARPVHAWVVVASEDHTRTIFYTTEDRVERQADEALEALVARSAVVLVDPFALAAARVVLPRARERGVSVVVDLELEHAGPFAGILEYVDHVVAPLPAALGLRGCAEAREAVRGLAAGRRAAVVTMGAEGALYAAGENPNDVRHQPAFEVETKNTTGCGDVFHGAYCLGVARGWSLEKTVRFASAAAAVRAEDSAKPGAVTDLARVEALLQGSE